MKIKCSKCNEELVSMVTTGLFVLSLNSIEIRIVPCINCMAKERLKVAVGGKEKLKDG